MTIFIGSNNGESFKFRESDMHEMGLLGGSYTDPQAVADILACNVEVPEIDEDGCVEINESNFNDSFGDMIAELSE